MPMRAQNKTGVFRAKQRAMQTFIMTVRKSKIRRAISKSVIGLFSFCCWSLNSSDFVSEALKTGLRPREANRHKLQQWPTHQNALKQAKCMMNLQMLQRTKGR